MLYDNTNQFDYVMGRHAHNNKPRIKGFNVVNPLMKVKFADYSTPSKQFHQPVFVHDPAHPI